MSKAILSDAKIKALKPKTKPYKASDGTIGGLHVAVSTAGGKVFCLAYRFDNKWRLLRLGAWPVFSLDEARDLAREAKKQIALGVDPAAARKAARNKERAATTTFRMLTARWLRWRQPILSAVAMDDAVKKLEKHILPHIGDKPIGEVTKADIKAVLDPLQAQGKYETLKKVRTIISQALRFAIDEEETPGIKGGKYGRTKKTARQTAGRQPTSKSASVTGTGKIFMLKTLGGNQKYTAKE